MCIVLQFAQIIDDLPSIAAYMRTENGWPLVQGSFAMSFISSSLILLALLLKKIGSNDGKVNNTIQFIFESKQQKAPARLVL